MPEEITLSYLAARLHWHFALAWNLEGLLMFLYFLDKAQWRHIAS